MCGAVTKGASGMCPREIGQRPRRAGPTAAGEPGPGARPGEALPSACILLTPLFQSGFTAVGTEGNQPSLSPSGQSPASVSEDLREKVGEANRSPRPCAWSGSRDWPCWLGGLTPTGCLIRPGSCGCPSRIRAPRASSVSPGRRAEPPPAGRQAPCSSLWVALPVYSSRLTASGTLTSEPSAPAQVSQPPTLVPELPTWWQLRSQRQET